ncbi:Fibroblast growth factor-binding protein 2 [Oryzias melastigma]|uniref:Fibroblast growth factor binding protein 2a n=1 Tax=Oryzias melastigma TaxID=30732 RepID=A0A3B3BA18_ORYME|nr:fibroblast growth factor binding protein 2a [Oryzias melastigma]XP_024126522.1 fibroblast growth factor binding protein 2a [Oryzias melastigma]KAF6731585.1 Fibroblast growth factor-binding protein 2 [Oryzias melastigma]
MWVQAAALLLLACCVWPAQSQRDGSRAHNIWEKPISFNTKGKDKCTMIITGQGENTRLRLSCRSSERFYWCEFVGKPHTCSAYNKRPRHYFVQIMWYLRKLQNACQGQRQFKPFMCRKASDDSQMVFSSSSSHQPQQEAPQKPAVRPAKQPAAPSRPTPARHSQRKAIRARPRVKPTQITNTKATAPPGESTAKRMSRQYCWRSLQGICSFVIGVFRS